MSKFVRKSAEERKREILKAATAVFLKKGYRNTTMEDIIRETSLSKGGFYHYFKSTKELLLAIFEEDSRTEIGSMEALVSFTGDKRALIDMICGYLVQQFFQEYDERQIFLMVVCEVLYDREYQSYIVEMEREFVINAAKYLLDGLPAPQLERAVERFRFLSKVFHALTIDCHLFQQQEIYLKNMGYIKNMFAEILADVFGGGGDGEDAAPE